MTLTALLLPDEVEDRRQGPRYRVRLGLVTADLGPEIVRVAIHEVSATGLLLRSERALQPGATLTIELPNARSKVATIVWANQWLYGVTFAEPLTSHQLQTLRKASTVVWPRFPDSQQVGEPGPRARIQKTVFANETALESTEKLPLPQRLQVIFGSTAVLWAMILGGAWLVA
jgi:hypothetical protein